MPIHLPPISRRRFLSGALAAGAASFLPQQVWSQSPSPDPNCFALLSDIHIPERRDQVMMDVTPTETLSKALDAIVRDSSRPTGILVAGDCAFVKGRSKDYAMLGELLKPVRKAGLHVHLALGNHDHRERLEAAFPELNAAKVADSAVSDKFISVVETPHANWFLLDSLMKTNVTSGVLGEIQLAWLAKMLDSQPDKPALLLAHHNPQNSGTNALSDTEAFFRVIAPRKQVKAYFFGHLHRWHIGHLENLHLVNLPATAWLFDPKQPRGFVDARLRPDGITLVLRALDPKHPKNDERVDLKWRV
jgi:3',5'-cyclic-AMP phosphodiesterase